MNITMVFILFLSKNHNHPQGSQSSYFCMTTNIDTKRFSKESHFLSWTQMNVFSTLTCRIWESTFEKSQISWGGNMCVPLNKTACDTEGRSSLVLASTRYYSVLRKANTDRIKTVFVSKTDRTWSPYILQKYEIFDSFFAYYFTKSYKWICR